MEKRWRVASGSVRARPGMRRADEMMELATVAAHARDLPEFFATVFAAGRSDGICGMVRAWW